MMAINEFQTQPEKAAEKYKDNPEIQKVFKEFCGIMGMYFIFLMVIYFNHCYYSTQYIHFRTRIMPIKSGRKQSRSTYVY